MTGATRPWLLIAAAALGLFVVNVDFFALNLALPRIAQGLDTLATDLQWIVSGYMLAFGALLMPAGRLGTSSAAGGCSSMGSPSSGGVCAVRIGSLGRVADWSARPPRSRRRPGLPDEHRRDHECVPPGVGVVAITLGVDRGEDWGWTSARTPIGLGAIGLVLLTSLGGWGIYVPAFALCGLGFGRGWSYTSVGTQAVVPREEAGQASGVTLTVVIGIAGFSVVAGRDGDRAARARGHSEGSSIVALLRVVAIGGLVLAAALALVARVFSASDRGSRPG